MTVKITIHEGGRLYRGACGGVSYEVRARNLGYAWIAVMDHLGAHMPSDLPPSEPPQIRILLEVADGDTAPDLAPVGAPTQKFDASPLARVMNNFDKTRS